MNKIKQFFASRSLWISLGSIALMAIISLAFFYPDAVEGNILQQPDVRQGMAVGHEAQQFHETTGETTRWTNSLFGGMPTFQISPSYPSNALFSWLNDAMGLWMPFPANILFAMMFGFYILMLAMRMRKDVALIAAIAYGFSSYFIILIGAGHIWKFVTLAYVPPTIAGMMLAYRGRFIAGAALTALFGMLQIAANHVQMTYYFLFVIVGIAIAFLISALRTKEMRKFWKATAALAMAGILAVAANLPSLYNTYEYSKETMRGGHSELTSSTDNASESGLNRDYITTYSYGIDETFTLLIPNVKGGATVLPQKGQNQLLSLAELKEADNMLQSGEIDPQTAYYLQQFPQYFGDPEGTNGPVYIGALIVALFLVGCLIVRSPLKWALIVLTLLSIALAWGRHFIWLTDLMIDYMPLYNKFRTPESILVIAEFTMPLLAAMGLQKLLTAPKGEVWKMYGKKIVWCFAVPMFICLITYIMPGVFGPAVTDMEREVGVNEFPMLYNAIESLRMSMVRADALRSLLILAAGFAALWAYMRGKLKAVWAMSIVGVLVLGDLYMINKRYLNHESFMTQTLSADVTFPLTESDRAILADTAMNYRVMDFKRFTSPDPSYHHKAIGGYHAAKLSRYQDLIDYYFTGERDYMNILNMLNARYVVADPSQLPILNPEAMGNAWFVDKVDFVDNANAEIAAIESLSLDSVAVADRRFSSSIGIAAGKSAGDTIFETSYAPNHLTYSATTAKGATAVFSEVYFPWGWHATIDGKPAEISRVNYILRGIDIPAGHHTVEMWFDPDSLHTTTTVATVAVIIIYLLIIGALTLAIVRKEPDTTSAE